jgi:gamma-glutamylcyclotransferase (GGCT)/AIG2-like uncharacterized protein YtfP
VNLFVYGTLLAGMSRHTSLAGTRRLGPASVEGTLWDLGFYAGLKEGTGVVTGELHEVDGSVLRRVDKMEGFDAGDPHGSLYVRHEVSARLFSDGTPVPAATYFYNQATGNAALIAHGDYRRYKAAPKDDQVLVIAYGSNLSSQRLAPRVKWEEPGVIDGKRGNALPGYLEGFRLTFNKAPKSGGPPYANIEYVGGESRCPAVAWLLTSKEVALLDRCEGAPSDDGTFHYYRIGLPFMTKAGTQSCHAYIANPDWVHRQAPPAASYVEHIRTGYQEFGLDLRHLDEALSRASEA